jgi:predicted amidophosphoribosyltransferase
VSILKKLVFPPRCVACRCLLPFDGEGGERALCLDCRAEWEIEKLTRCPDCRRAMLDCRCMPDMIRNAGCAGLVRLVSYDPARPEGAANRITHNIKRIKDSDAFDFLTAQLLMPIQKRLEEFELEITDMTVTFCPRRHSARRKYGFDQSEQLARRLATLGGAKFVALLERRHTIFDREQKRLTAAERLENTSRAVRLTRAGCQAAGERVILLDDVVTTGATFSACADLLRGAGVQLVIGACLAVAVKKPRVKD